jgi:NosR/NirI family nitrous oxide reductase transcriptional regulator
MRNFGDAIILGTVSALVLCGGAFAVERFPPPDFESGYQLPSPTTPAPRQDIYQYVDVLVLFAALVVSSYLVLRKRSRRLIFALMVFSLAYFGFWRNGCVCSIGAIQNIALSIFDSGYAVGFVGAAFFLLPLVFTLFFGRTFCAAVCPLGAIQDVVLLKPVSVPGWLESSLRLFAYVYLGLAVLFAATGSAFVICRYDPFVSFFRLSGNLNLLILGACFLLVGVFVGRPYCRFVCPYGIILRQLSRVSRWRVSITPDECIKCRLCEDSCPFGAIEKPTVEWPMRDLGGSKKRLGLMIILLPVLIAVGGWAVSAGGGPMSRMHSTVRLAERIYLEQAGQAEGTTDASSAFRATGRELKELYAEAAGIQAHFALGGWMLGGFVGLVTGLKLIRHSLWQQRDDYQAEMAGCVACGRCFKYCPREHIGSGKTKEAIGQKV